MLRLWLRCIVVANIWLLLLSVVVGLAHRRVGLRLLIGDLWLLVDWCMVVACLRSLVALILRLRLGVVALGGVSKMSVVSLVVASGNVCGADGEGVKGECERLHD